jgi:uncharacterized protein YggE
MRPVRVAILIAVAGAVAAFAGVGLPEGAHGVGAAAEQEVAKRVITVNGSGAVTTVPDRASFSFGVVAQGKTATAAMNAAGAEAQRLVAALKAAGIASADLQTESVSLSPRMSPDGETIVGYTASTSVSAILRNLDRAGAIVDAAVAAGANQVYGPALTRTDTRSLYRSALRAAFAEARDKARVLAAAAGARLGAILAVTEGSSSPPIVIGVRKAGADAASVPIEPGTQTIEATVTVQFAIG